MSKNCKMRSILASILLLFFVITVTALFFHWHHCPAGESGSCMQCEICRTVGKNLLLVMPFSMAGIKLLQWSAVVSGAVGVLLRPSLIRLKVKLSY